MKERPPVSHSDFEALVLFVKQLHARLERLEDGLAPMPKEDRLQPTENKARPITTRERQDDRLDELEFRIEGIEKYLDRQILEK